MRRRWLFLAAYACSGLAGLIYEVIWSRLLSLYMGHTTAATSTVVAAFMGGLAIGAAVGGRLASRFTARQTLWVYAALESLVVLTAILVPAELAALRPLLAWSYRDSASGALFPLVRLISCFGILLPPTMALGATFPVAVRWFARTPLHPGRDAGGLYAANTTGAALGALGAGFMLLPALGMSGTTVVGGAGSGLAIVLVLALARNEMGSPDAGQHASVRVRAVAGENRAKRGARRTAVAGSESSSPTGGLWLAATVVALTGVATFIFEIAWTRLFSMIIGPSTYAFAATLTALISGTAAGSGVGSVVAGRTKRPAFMLTLALAGAAIAASWACSFAGGPLPRLVADELARSPRVFEALLLRHSMLAAALIVPTAAALGVAFPLALELTGSRGVPVARRLGAVYAVNSLAAVAGSLVSGFLALPFIGLQHTLQLASALLIVGTVTVLVWGPLSRAMRVAACFATAGAIAMLAWSPPWDRELLASGIYKYTKYVARDSDVETSLTAGRLLYYRDRAAATVSVKRLTGALSLAIDGKIDASTSGDMLTQKLLAHLPLLLHSDPHQVCIIGLGSGVTLASSLVHPIASVDVVEISPEVVEASRYFAHENRNALADPRAHLIVGDGRSHMQFSSHTYDVIISEPSNPWMAGIASLFTREFFTALRARLAPGGIVCQWTHTYDISEGDLRSVVATFASIFPNGTMWLIGDGDLLLIGSADPLDSRLANIAGGWTRPGVAADLSGVSVREPFALWSLFVGGPAELQRYATGAPLQTDDRMALEFSGPRALYGDTAPDNAARLLQLLDPTERPPTIARAYATANAAEWRNRGAMMLQADVYAVAYHDYVTAVKLDPTDPAALDGLARSAVVAREPAEAIDVLRTVMSTRARTPAILSAISRILAASGSFDQAIVTAKEAAAIEPVDPGALEQLASLYADAGDAARLDEVVLVLQSAFPERPGSRYYRAASQFLHQNVLEALRLAEQTIALDPQRAAAHNLLGAIHASRGESQAAREAFEAALRLNPRDSATYTNLGLLDLSLHNRADAAGSFAEALSLDPASPAARDGLAQARSGLTVR